MLGVALLGLGLWIGMLVSIYRRRYSMGDMAPRPRGGWQFGTRLPRRRAVDDDGRPDPAPDVYAVARDGDGFVVRHYPSADAETPCCVLKVPRKPGEADVDALARAARHCDAKHGGRS